MRMKSLKVYRSKSSAKKKAWDAFSMFIRVRDCLKTTGSFFHGKCFTCEKDYLITELQAGHFVPGRGNAVLFDELGVRGQCKACNIFKYGETILFRRKLVLELGEEIVSSMEDKRWRVKKYSLAELDALRIYYLQKIEELKAGK